MHFFLLIAAAAIPGNWHEIKDNTVRRKPDVAVDAMLGRMREVAKIFRKDKALDPPMGFTVLPWISAEHNERSLAAGSFGAIVINHYKRPDGTLDTTGDGEGLSFGVRANDLRCAHDADFEFGDGKLYAARASEEFRGFLKFDDCVVIARKPPVVPATRARVAAAALAQLKGTRVEPLLAVADADKDKPAIVDLMALYECRSFGKCDAPLFAEAPAPTAVAIVTRNPELFDQSRPSEVQMLSVTFACVGRRPSQWCAQFPGTFERIRDGLDWDALGKLVQ